MISVFDMSSGELVSRVVSASRRGAMGKEADPWVPGGDMPADPRVDGHEREQTPAVELALLPVAAIGRR